MNKLLEYYDSEIKKYGTYEKYAKAKAIEKKPLLDMVKKYAKNRIVLEAGCGTAVNSFALAKSGFVVLSIDKNQEMIKFVGKNLITLNGFPELIHKDIFNLWEEFEDHFSVSFSHGVLEHYSDKDIIKLINEQLSIAKTVIFSVPSNFFKQSEAINGDERFLSKEYWKNLISKTNGKLLESFDYFYDSYELRIKALKLLSKITSNKLPIVKPYLGFVVARR